MVLNDLVFPAFEPGWVWLCGAGPGDPGLLTLHALHALRSADVIVHDALIGEAVLALAPPHVRREFAGKRGGRPSPRQPDISARLIALAQEGKRVLRLKGGDPFVFGRGAEEGLQLAAAGVQFRVIPGITSGLGGIATAGIPATWRDSNAAVLLLTGHDANGVVPPRLDWSAISRAAPVLVVYMALAHLGSIAEALIAAGRRPEEPVALVADASLEQQRRLDTTLATCAADVAAAGIGAPALVVIGAVARLTLGDGLPAAFMARLRRPGPAVPLTRAEAAE